MTDLAIRYLSMKGICVVNGVFNNAGIHIKVTCSRQISKKKCLSASVQFKLVTWIMCYFFTILICWTDCPEVEFKKYIFSGWWCTQSIMYVCIVNSLAPASLTPESLCACSGVTCSGLWPFTKPFFFSKFKVESVVLCHLLLHAAN